MSAENGKVCCNCRHCIRQWDIEDKGMCQTYCEIDKHYIGYVECHEGWCRHWSRDNIDPQQITRRVREAKKARR